MTDQELLERYYDSRENDWLGILLQRYTLLLLGVCMKYLKEEEEARDCVQQIFVKVITELGKYRVVYFKSWIYTIARNHCLMKLRDQHGHPAELSDAMLAAWDDEPGSNKHWEKEQWLEWMGQSLAALGERAKTLCNFVLPAEKVLPGYSNRDRIYVNAGKEPYPEWEKEPETVNGETGPRKSELT